MDEAEGIDEAELTAVVSGSSALSRPNQAT
jgi:hypothetical protein